MAKVKFGMMMTDASGKLGGQVFSKNRGGNYVRTKAIPSNPQTLAQTSVRALFGAIAQTWSGLTEEQRVAFNGVVDSWKRTDVFGDLKSPSGKALFQRLNQQAQVVGYPAITVAPLPTEIASGVITAAAFDITNETITLTGMSISADSKVQLFATAPQSAGTKFVKNKLRQIYFELGSAYDSAEAGSGYIDKFGTPAAGANVSFGVKYVDANGNSTPMQIIKATVAV